MPVRNGHLWDRSDRKRWIGRRHSKARLDVPETGASVAGQAVEQFDDCCRRRPTLVFRETGSGKSVESLAVCCRPIPGLAGGQRLAARDYRGEETSCPHQTR
jgi:hypothetical protein